MACNAKYSRFYGHLENTGIKVNEKQKILYIVTYVGFLTYEHNRYNCLLFFYVGLLQKLIRMIIAFHAWNTLFAFINGTKYLKIELRRNCNVTTDVLS